MINPGSTTTKPTDGSTITSSSFTECIEDYAPTAPPTPWRVGICYLRPTAAEHRGVGLCVMFRAALASAGWDFAEAPVSGDLQLPAAATALAQAGASVVLALFPKSCNANRSLSGLLAAAAAGVSVPLLHGEYVHEYTEANPDAELTRLKGTSRWRCENRVSPRVLLTVCPCMLPSLRNCLL
jgi:hypothetical protein